MFFLSGDNPASEFYVPTFRNTLSHPRNATKERIERSEHGVSLKSRIYMLFHNLQYVLLLIPVSMWIKYVNFPKHCRHCVEIITNLIYKIYLKYKGKGKGKAIPLQAWTGPQGSRRLRLPDF